MTLAQYDALGIVSLNGGDKVTLADTGATLAGLSAAEIAALAPGLVDVMDATDDALALAIEQFRALGSVALSGTDALTVAGSAANDYVNFSAYSVASVTFIGGGGSDEIRGSSGTNVLEGGGARDKIFARGADTIRYATVSDSTSSAYDLVDSFDATTDLIDLWSAVVVTGVEAAITVGKLRGGANFDPTLEAAVNASNLAANHAVIFMPDAGELAGTTFLVVDIDGAAGYQGGQDLAIQMQGLAGSIGTGTFT
jgi:Ca2+-binding RTX toxin-like protein